MGRADDSKRRLLDAATAEFARFGLAGSRVDRIAAEAHVNKAQLYGWYVSKDALFDAVFDEHLMQILHAVPVTGQDLPGYAVRLYDAYLERPELVRLSAWRRLERVPDGDLFAHLHGHDQQKLRSIGDAQRDGHVDPTLDPADVLSLVTAMSLTWSPLSLGVAATPDEDRAVHERRKRALAHTVAAAFGTR